MNVGTDSPALAGTLVDLRPRTLLHFLALTRKTGRLHVHQNLHHAAVWLRDGEVVCVDQDPLDSVFEMLRMGNGDFGFEEELPPETDKSERMSVTSLLEQAGELLAELHEAAQTVPSMAVVIELRHCDDEARLSADSWNVSMAVAAGDTTPQQVAAHLRWGTLRTCRAVKELVDTGRAVVLPPVRETASWAGLGEPTDVVLTSATPAPALWPGGGAEATVGWRTPWYDPGE